MPIENTLPGGDFHDFEIDCNAGAVVLWRIIEHQPRQTVGENEADPVVVDMVILTGPNKGLVRRGERLVPRGITGSLRKSRVGAETVSCMGWSPKPGRNGKPFVCANPANAEQLEWAKQVYASTGNDPWFAAERAAMENPLENSAAPAPVAAAPAPVPTPAASTPAAPPVTTTAQAEPAMAGAGATPKSPW